MGRVLRWIGLSLGVLLVAGACVLCVVLRARRAEAGAVEQISPDVYHVHNFLTDIYAAHVGGQVVLFDAGMDPDGLAIDRLLEALGAGRNAVTDIFLTHAHFDHVAAADLYPNARVHIGAEDAAMLAQRVPTEPITPRLFGAIFGTTEVEASDRLEGESAIGVGAGKSVLAIPFPGHTPGSFLFLFDGTLFTGDSILLEAGKLTPANPKYSMNAEENRRSISRLTDVMREARIDVVCTGHMGCTKAEQTRGLLEALIRSAKSTQPI